MSKKGNVIMGLACFFAGIATGFAIAPIKVKVFSENKNGDTYDDVVEESNTDNNEEAKELDETMAEVSEIIIDDTTK